MVFGIGCVSVFAADDPVCANDMSRLTCASGTFNDGTGVAIVPSIHNNPRRENREKIMKSSLAKFKKSLSDPSNKYFIKQVLSASGHFHNPECKVDENNLYSEKCLDLLAESASDVALNRLIGEGISKKGGTQIELANENYFAESTPFNNIQKELVEEAKVMQNHKELNAKIKEIFPQLVDLISAKMAKNIQDPQLRKNLQDKLSALEFKGVDCTQGVNDNLADVFVPNAFYHMVGQNIRYCAGMNDLNTSEFSLAHVMAHEIAHSIDPCNIALGPTDYAFKYKKIPDQRASKDNVMPYNPYGGSNTYPTISQLGPPGQMGQPSSQTQTVIDPNQLQNPYNTLMACLRSSASIAAQPEKKQSKEDASQSNTDGRYHNRSNKTNASKKSKSLIEETPFCDDDQIGEAVADWYAFEILPEFIQKRYPNLTKEQYKIGYSNVFRSADCKDDVRKEGVHASHPTTRDRIDKLLMSQPIIRKQIGCNEASEYHHCNNDNPMATQGDKMMNFKYQNTYKAEESKAEK